MALIVTFSSSLFRHRIDAGMLEVEIFQFFLISTRLWGLRSICDLSVLPYFDLARQNNISTKDLFQFFLISTKVLISRLSTYPIFQFFLISTHTLQKEQRSSESFSSSLFRRRKRVLPRQVRRLSVLPYFDERVGETDDVAICFQFFLISTSQQQQSGNV